MTRRQIKILQNQAGAVSMIVAVLIMFLLTLIVLSMSKNARNEQRQSLDRQLSDQAFYNAESGINDTLDYLYKNRNDATVPDEYNSDCNFINSLGTKGDIDGVSGVNKYTCILYDKSPKTIILDDVGMADSKIIPIEPTGGMTSLVISWDDSGTQNNVSGCNFTGPPSTLPTSLPANCIGGVRVDLIPQAGNRDALNEATLSAFLLPGANSAGPGASMTFPNSYPDRQGAIGVAKCNNSSTTERKCKITLNNIPQKSTMRIKSLYRAVDINIEGLNGPTPVEFNNAQIMIDSTGKANDVLRRIQVRVPAGPQFLQAEFGIHAKDSICKIIDVKETTAAVSDTHPERNRCPLN
jgi:hypothetical protein